MKITFLGTGHEGTNNRTQSSLLVSKDNLNVLVNCSKDLKIQIEREKVSKIDCAIISSQLGVQGISQLKEVLKGKKIPCIMSPETFQVLNQMVDLSFVDIRLFTPGITFNLGTMKVTPVEVVYSLDGRPFESYALQIDKVLYAERVSELKGAAFPFFENNDVLILDATTWLGTQIKGHINTKTALELGRHFKPNTLILTNLSGDYPGNAQELVEKYWKRVRANKGTKVIIAEDGLKIKSNFLSQRLARNEEGIYLAPPNAKLIWQGEKDLIMSSDKLNSKDRFLYLIEGTSCYGIIRLNGPKRIEIKDVMKLEKYHKLTEHNLKQWWPSKQSLYAYTFKRMEMFESPKEVKIKKRLGETITTVEFTELEIMNEVKIPVQPEDKQIVVEENDMSKGISPKTPAINSINDLVRKAKAFPYIVENNEHDFHVRVCHKDGRFYISTEEGKDETKKYSHLMGAIKSLSSSDFIILGNIDKLNGKLYAYDIIEYKSQSLSDIPLRARKELLKKLSFDSQIRQSYYKLVESPAELEGCINQLSSKVGPLNLVIKGLDSKDSSSYLFLEVK